MFSALMDQLRVPRRGPGRPRTRPTAVLGDRAYSSRANRAHLRSRGICAVIPNSPPTALTAGAVAAEVDARSDSTPKNISAAT
jgi:hypothetical protein